MKEIIFVSGASRGIGNSIAKYFAEKGHIVLGTSRSKFKFDTQSDKLIPIQLDITSREDVKNCFKYLNEQNLLPSVLVNNAGITSDQLFLRMKDSEWDDVLLTNLTGVFNLTKVFIKHMIKNKYGRIINISSVSGENITYLIRELQNFIVKMKNKENSKNQRKKIISWSP